jgi:uncharacterized protein YcbX
VKSLRGVAVNKATITKYGFLYDRCYMLLKEDRTTPDVRAKNGCMLVGAIPEMALYTTAIVLPHEQTEGEITVTFNPPDADKRSISLPLHPETTGRDRVDVDLHGSKASAYDMGAKYSGWFSECFGYAVTLAAVGDQEREILFPGSPFKQPTSSSWLSSITKNVPVLGSLVGSGDSRIKFQDCAPFLLVTEKSSRAVQELMPEDGEFDVRKTRPNIVVSGQEPWEEDFWGEIAIAEAVKISLLHNCLRCQSLNVDFNTGKYSKEKNMEVLKLLQKDRRVDTAKKYNAVFGRYGFINAGSVGKEMKVGDAVSVTQRNDQRSGFGMLQPHAFAFAYFC